MSARRFAVEAFIIIDIATVVVVINIVVFSEGIQTGINETGRQRVRSRKFSHDDTRWLSLIVFCLPRFSLLPMMLLLLLLMLVLLLMCLNRQL